MGAILLAALSLPAASPGSAQAPSTTAARLDAMQKLDRWVGTWRGSGWSIDATGRRAEFNLVETVTQKVGGTVLLVEGHGTAKDATARPVVTHDGLVLLYYDEHLAKYRWNGHEFASGTVDAEPHFVDGGFEWSIAPAGQGATVRFTILFSGTQWREVGEVGTDGKAWNKFMEMNLDRVDSPAKGR